MPWTVDEHLRTTTRGCSEGGRVLHSTSAFRDDIQGMRALAVGLVILAHAGFGTVAGGFIGVDLFFVVSGYLIIGLLLREAQKDDRVSILGFYVRRARRILPAATLVLVVTMLLALWQWSFTRVGEVVKDVVWSSFFLANFRFTSVETDYFAADDPPSPVQHYWSLAVEEQFYLVIPLVVLVVTLLVRRFSGSAPQHQVRLRRALFAAVALLSLASFVWGVVLTADDVTRAYFSTPARAWELGVGGLAAMVGAGTGRRALRRWQAELVGWAGLLLVLWAAVSFDATTPFPGTAALVPVVGAVMMLWVGSTEAGSRTLLHRLLSVRVLTLLGAWSFSLYLWHWPVLQLAETRWGRPLEPAELVGVLVLTVLLSAASYYWVEEPFRRGVTWRRPSRAMMLYPASLALVLGSAWGAHSYVDRQWAAMADNPRIDLADYADRVTADDPVAALVQASLLAADDGRPIPGELQPALDSVRDSVAPLGDCDYREGMRRLCPFGDPDAERTIVVTGDSHARAWTPAFARIGELYGYRVHHFVYTGCPANSETRMDPDNGGTWEECRDFQEWVQEQVEELRPDLVVVANNAYRSAPFVHVQQAGLAQRLEELGAAADRVAMVGNVPVVRRLLGTCLTTRGAVLADCVQRPRAETRQMQLEFAEIARGAGAEYVDVHRWFCSKGRCPAVIGEHVALRDRDHVTVEYAEALAEPLARELRLDR